MFRDDISSGVLKFLKDNKVMEQEVEITLKTEDKETNIVTTDGGVQVSTVDKVKEEVPAVVTPELPMVAQESKIKEEKYYKVSMGDRNMIVTAKGRTPEQIKADFEKEGHKVTKVERSIKRYSESKVKEGNVSREDWEVIDEAVADVVANFKKITGVEGYKLIDLHGQFNDDVVNATMDKVIDYVEEKYPIMDTNMAVRDEFFVKLDEALMNAYADEAVQKAGGHDKVYGNECRMFKVGGVASVTDKFDTTKKEPSLLQTLQETVNGVQIKEDNKEGFIRFLQTTLIPDLMRSGTKETAKDFQALVQFLRGAKEANGYTKEEFVEFLKTTLIPDLKASGTDATAEDFEEGLSYLGESKVNEKYEVGDQIFKKDSDGGAKGKKGDTGKVTISGVTYRVKYAEKAEYPIGTPGWWLDVVDVLKKNESKVKEDKCIMCSGSGQFKGKECPCCGGDGTMDVEESKVNETTFKELLNKHIVHKKSEGNKVIVEFDSEEAAQDFMVVTESKVNEALPDDTEDPAHPEGGENTPEDTGVPAPKDGDTEEEPKKVVTDKTPDSGEEKEFLGSKGAEEFFYIKSEYGTDGSVQKMLIVDPTGKELMSSEEANVDVISDPLSFILNAIKTLEIAQVDMGIVDKYILKPEADKEIEQEEAAKAEAPKSTEEIKPEVPAEDLNKEKPVDL